MRLDKAFLGDGKTCQTSWMQGREDVGLDTWGQIGEELACHLRELAFLLVTVSISSSYSSLFQPRWFPASEALMRTLCVLLCLRLKSCPVPLFSLQEPGISLEGSGVLWAEVLVEL